MVSCAPPQPIESSKWKKKIRARCRIPTTGFSVTRWGGGFFEHYLSQEVLSGLDMSTLSLTGESFVDEFLKASQSDMVFSVQAAGGRSARLYLLLEHKSYPDPWVGLQLLGYVVRLWERERRRLKRPPLPAVIPMVLYQGEGDWDIPQFGELFDQADVQAGYTVDFQYGRYMLDAERFDRIEDNLELEIALRVSKIQP